jgi:accessory gene regulator B
LIDKFSLIISKSLVDRYPNEMPSLGVVKYAIKFIICNVIPVILILLLAMMSGQFNEVLIALVGFSLLRMFSGGYHHKSAVVCILVSTTMITIVPVIGLTEFASNYMWIISIISLILVLIYAPSNIKNQTKVKAEYHFIFKMISLLIVSSNFIWGNSILSISFLIQSILLIPYEKLRGGDIIE